ncbi:MAG: hypothetical protein K0U15_01230 [Proteobacteria bacterium]|nr:hypothetical protein [Pseudomonadota bacterium]
MVTDSAPWYGTSNGQLIVQGDELIAIPAETIAERAASTDYPNSYLWKSTDGVNWEVANSSPRIYSDSNDTNLINFAAVIYNDSNDGGVNNINIAPIVFTLNSQLSVLRDTAVNYSVAEFGLAGGYRANGYNVEISGDFAEHFSFDFASNKLLVTSALTAQTEAVSIVLTMDDIGYSESNSVQISLVFAEIAVANSNPNVESAGALYLLGGETTPYDYNDSNHSEVAHGYVLKSDNLSDWSVIGTEEAGSDLGVRAAVPLVSFGGYLYVIGGSDTSKPQVLRSLDGSQNSANSSWEVLADAPGWGDDIRGHEIFVHDRKLWLIHGVPDGATAAAAESWIWSSTDGKEWDFVASGEFDKMAAAGVTELDGVLYLVGALGADGEGSTNKVWRSTNASDWTEILNVTGLAAESADGFDTLRIIETDLVSYSNALYLFANARVSGGDVVGEQVTLLLFTSTNGGASWQRITQSAVSSPLASYTSANVASGWRLLVRSGQLLLIANDSNNGNVQIWTSVTGSSWQLEHSDVLAGNITNPPVGLHNIGAVLFSEIAANGQPLLAFTPRLSVRLSNDTYYYANDYTGAIASLTVFGGYAPNGYEVEIISGNENNYFAVSNNVLMLTVIANDTQAQMIEVQIDDAHDGIDAVVVTASMRLLTSNDYSGTYVQMEGDLYVIGGAENGVGQSAIWRSSDLTTWEVAVDLATVSEAAAGGVLVNHQVIVYNGMLLLLGGGTGSGNGYVGANNTVYMTSDGVNWTTAAANFTAPRHHAGLVVQNNRLWLFGGSTAADTGGAITPYGDVWSSADGVVWRLENATAFTPLAGMAAAVQNNGRIVAVGGIYGDDNYSSDVWVSDNGVNWSQLQNVVGLPAGSGGDLVVYGGDLYYSGWGSDDDNAASERVLRSQDGGTTWTTITDPTPWGKLQSGRLAVLGQELVMVGGAATASEQNDTVRVWMNQGQANWHPQVSYNGNTNPRIGHDIVVFAAGEPQEELVAPLIASITSAHLQLSVGFSGSLAQVAASSAYPDKTQLDITFDTYDNLLAADNNAVINVTQALPADLLGKVLTVSVSVVDDYTFRVPVKFGLTFTVYAQTLLLSASAATVSVGQGKAQDAIYTAAVTSFSHQPYQYAIDEVTPALVAALNPFAVDSASGVIDLTVGLDVTETVTVKVKATDVGGGEATLTLAVVNRPSLVVENATLVINGDAAGTLLYTVAPDPESGLLPLGLFTRDALVPNSAETRGNILVGANSGEIALVNTLSSTPRTVTVSVGVSDSTGATVTSEVVLRFVSGVTLVTADAVTIDVDSNASAFYTVAAANPNERFSNTDYSLVSVNSDVLDATQVNLQQQGTVALLSLLTPYSAGGSLTVYVALQDSPLTTSTLALTLVVAEKVTFAPDTTNLSAHYAFVGTLYTLGASEGLAPFTYSLVTTVPPALSVSINATSGEVVFASLIAPTMQIVAEVVDSFGNKARQTTNLTVISTVALNPATLTLGFGVVGEVFTLQALPGLAPFSFEKIDGDNDDIVVLTDGKIRVENALAAGGAFFVQVRVTDDNNDTATVIISLVVQNVFTANFENQRALVEPGDPLPVAQVVQNGGSGGANYTLTAINGSNDLFATAADGKVYIQVYSRNTTATATLVASDQSGALPVVSITLLLTVATGENVSDDLVATGTLMFAGGGFQGKHQEVFTSGDGTTWTELVDNAASDSFFWRRDHAFVSHNGTLYIIAGDASTGGSHSSGSGGRTGTQIRNDVWSSADGDAWVQVVANAPFSARENLFAVSYKGEMIIGGGSGSGGGNNGAEQVWASSDGGANWTRRSDLPGTPTWARAAVLNGTLFVTGRKDSYATSDTTGAWTKIAENRDYLDTNFELQTFNNRLLAIGGLGHTNDVWASADGSAWVRIQDNMGFEKEFFGAAYNSGTLYVYGGLSSNTNNNDVWKSTDAINWTQVSTNGAPLPARSALQMLTFDGEADTQGLSFAQENVTLSLAIDTVGAAYTVAAAPSEYFPQATISYEFTNIVPATASAQLTIGSINGVVEYVDDGQALVLTVSAQVQATDGDSTVTLDLVLVRAAVDGFDLTAIEIDLIQTLATVNAYYKGEIASFAIDGGYVGKNGYDFNAESSALPLFSISATANIFYSSNDNLEDGSILFYQLTLSAEDQLENVEAGKATLSLAVLQVAVPPLALVENNVSVLVAETTGDILTLTATGGYQNVGDSYTYELLATTPDTPNVALNNGVVALNSALNSLQTIVLSVRISEVTTVISEVTLVVVPTVLITAKNTLNATPNNIGYLGSASAIGGIAPYVFSLQAVTPAAIAQAANITVATS